MMRQRSTTLPLMLLLPLLLVGCGPSTPPAPNNPPAANVSPAANANKDVRGNISPATGPLLGRWKRTDHADEFDNQFKFKSDGTYDYLVDGKNVGSSKYEYLTARKVQSYDLKTGKATRTFEFTVKDDKMVMTWDQGAKPNYFDRVKDK